MLGISAVFNIAKGALRANQVAMEVASHNIANLSTPGYSRQRALIEAESPFVMSRFKVGMGVRVDSVTQAFDGYTTRTIHQNASALNEYQSKASALSHLEVIFNETGAGSLSQAMAGFWNAWQEVANNPGGAPERTLLLEKAKTLTGKFNSLSADLTQMRQSLSANLASGVDKVNELARRIADLNGKIVASEASGTTANDFRDLRNTLLEEMSSHLGTVYVENQHGAVTVMTPKGNVLVSGAQSWGLRAHGDSIYWNEVESDIGRDLTGGRIGGWLDVRDEILAQEKANLDELAGTFIREVNALHAAGYTRSGATGMNFFQLFRTSPEVPNAGDYTGAAAFIALSSDVLGRPENVAAGGVSGAAGDNQNALAIAALQTSGALSIRKWTVAERGAITASSLQTVALEDYYRDQVGEIGIRAEGFNENQQFVQAMLDRLGEIRDSYSGVNLDEELTEMIKLQRGYEAASKVISVADQMLQTLLGLR